MRAITLNNQNIDFHEPFKGLFTQGMVCHETYKDENNEWLSPDEITTKNGKDFFKKNNPAKKVTVGPSESMSKSKKNTIDPENIINDYGADAVRLFILADSPPERDIQWTDEGMISYYKFIQKLWVLSEDMFNILEDKKYPDDNKLNEFTNQIIDKINIALEKFRYNIIVACYHEIYSFFKKIIEEKKNYSNLKKNFEKIIITMIPVIPHFAYECLDRINYKDDILWPEIDRKFLEFENTNIVIQINGKKRSILKTKKNLEEEVIKNTIKDKELIAKYVENKKIVKTIYIKNKIINYIIH